MSGLLKFFPPHVKEPYVLTSGLSQKILLTQNNSIFKNKIVFFYFTAGWCPHCVKFSPTLVRYYDIIQEKYNKNNKNNNKNENKNNQMIKPFEVIVVPWETNQKDLKDLLINDYSGKFYTLPLHENNNNENDNIINHFNKSVFHISQIPSLVAVDADRGVLVSSSMIPMIKADVQDGGERYPWW
ncbi:tryparedoxin [Angomonas deanei]|uniref:protein-disulfide reductase n=1 Tax=Angomonas deanei TaxID=59799 RepID=A0A7G2CHV6_9TRYP|nr:tryparedoxin [Angomonas deanei]CAD2218504.1 Thioredoxin-like, putative [Angomonas deanei]|eukprot:EPY37944.1 tryparedoxin [Angomonas deanei]